MKILLTCLTFILSNIVIAEASVEGLMIQRIETKQWTAKFAGETELDGVTVVAALEESAHELSIPGMLTVRGLVPMNPIVKKSYQLVFTSVAQQNLKASYPLEFRTVSIDGNLQAAYISPNDDKGFRFMIVKQKDGTLNASYTRKVSDTEIVDGAFSLEPLMTVL